VRYISLGQAGESHNEPKGTGTETDCVNRHDLDGSHAINDKTKQIRLVPKGRKSVRHVHKSDEGAYYRKSEESLQSLGLWNKLLVFSIYGQTKRL